MTEPEPSSPVFRCERCRGRFGRSKRLYYGGLALCPDCYLTTKELQEDSGKPIPEGK